MLFKTIFIGGGNILDVCKNMRNLFDYFIRNLSNITGMKKCPMFWRLYLHYISETSPSDYKKCYYEAVENCPWHKVHYILNCIKFKSIEINNCVC